jgi:hypothetical protein
MMILNIGNTQFFATRRRVSLLDRPRRDVLVVEWSDPLRGHCGEQFWQLVTARAGGECAFSGTPIRKGDAVFKPRQRGQAKFNASDMILENAVPESIGACDEQEAERPGFVA